MIGLVLVRVLLREFADGAAEHIALAKIAGDHRRAAGTEHIDFHFRVIDEVFDAAVAPEEAPSGSFDAAPELDAAALADVQARVRTRVLRTFVKRGLIDKVTPPGRASGRTKISIQWCPDSSPSGRRPGLRRTGRRVGRQAKDQPRAHACAAPLNLVLLCAC